MTREQVAEKVAWIIAGMAAEYHGRTIEPGQVFPSDTLVMHGIDDHLALFEFSYLAEKALGIAVSDELLDLDNDATVATLVDRIAGELREHEIQSSRRRGAGMGPFERSPSHRGSERTSSAARWRDDVLAEIDAWQRGQSCPEAIRRLIRP